MNDLRFTIEYDAELNDWSATLIRDGGSLKVHGFWPHDTLEHVAVTVIERNAASLAAQSEREAASSGRNA